MNMHLMIILNFLQTHILFHYTSQSSPMGRNIHGSQLLAQGLDFLFEIVTEETANLSICIFSKDAFLPLTFIIFNIKVSHKTYATIPYYIIFQLPKGKF